MNSTLQDFVKKQKDKFFEATRTKMIMMKHSMTQF